MIGVERGGVKQNYKAQRWEKYSLVPRPYFPVSVRGLVRPIRKSKAWLILIMCSDVSYVVWDDARWNAKSPTHLQATTDAGTVLCRLSCPFVSECSTWPIERTSECCVYSKLFETLQLYFGHNTFWDGQLQSLLPLFGVCMIKL